VPEPKAKGSDHHSCSTRNVRTRRSGTSRTAKPKWKSHACWASAARQSTVCWPANAAASRRRTDIHDQSTNPQTALDNARLEHRTQRSNPLDKERTLKTLAILLALPLITTSLANSAFDKAMDDMTRYSNANHWATPTPRPPSAAKARAQLEIRIGFDQLQTGDRDSEIVEKAPVIYSQADYNAILVGDFYFYGTRLYLKCRYPPSNGRYWYAGGDHPGDTPDSAVRLHSKDDEAKIRPGQWVIDYDNDGNQRVWQWPAPVAQPTATPWGVIQTSPSPLSESPYSAPTPSRAPSFGDYATRAFIVLGFIALLATLAKFCNKPRKPRNPQPEPPPPPPRPVYVDYIQFQMALELWRSKGELFDKNENDRLAKLNEEIKKRSFIAPFLFLCLSVGAYWFGSTHGTSVGWWTFGIGMIFFSMLANAEESFNRWRCRALFVRRLFEDPEPLYEPPRHQRTPKQEYQEPPQQNDLCVTSLRQAYGILGLPPGRITLEQARKAHRSLIAQYHPDKVAHLGEELRKLAAVKSVRINLAMDFIDEHCK
jgi:hypothetical protein